MVFKLGKLLLCLQALLSAVALGQQKKDCTEELPNLEAGHIQLNDKNYAKWSKENAALAVIAISDSSCNTCC